MPSPKNKKALPSVFTPRRAFEDGYPFFPVSLPAPPSDHAFYRSTNCRELRSAEFKPSLKRRASYGAAILCGPTDRRCWKHSRQYTGRPCVGLNGTVVSFPHCEHTVLVSTRCTLPEPAVVPAERLALHALHRLGSFLKPLSAKNICSPAVKTNSAEHSAHFKTLSWYSIRCSKALLEQE
jgi:hypothetical protein